MTVRPLSKFESQRLCTERAALYNMVGLVHRMIAKATSPASRTYYEVHGNAAIARARDAVIAQAYVCVGDHEPERRT
jgi:hypothetical protein